MGTTYKELFKLYDLIQSGDARSVERFLNDNTVDLNIILPCKGIGVLHLAVGIEPVDKSKKCTEIILKHGGDPNLSNDDGVTPVHIAAIWGKVDNMKLLLGCGGDPSRCDLDGISAFDYAVREQQWEVYEYLHNVVNETDDSIGSQCAYTLDLERIRVTTDQVVAEYEPVEENKLNDASVPRKSEMIRDWFDKNSLVINKLYPTILGETFFVENESEPWRHTDTHILNNAQDNLDETSNTFRTCLSKKSEVELSGINPLELTLDKSRVCSCTNDSIRRGTIYENFSLPGSPNSIIHKNYNNKTSLKKCKIHSSNYEMKSSQQSVLTEDSDVDRVLAVAQNKTNEWLSTCSDVSVDIKAGNTRRSSASSGVSSSYSGSILLASIQEEYRYEDKEEDVALLERRLLVSSVVLPVEETADSPDQTILSVASSLPTSMEYDNNTLRAELVRLGFKPGPIQENTKTLYLKKLQALKKNPIIAQHENKTYSVELEKSLRSDTWIQNLSPYTDLENIVKADFAKQDKKWREGNAKTSFTYLLLDPRVTANLPAKGQQNPYMSWSTFINSIFYVGKGKRSRPYSHLYQALSLWKKNFKQSGDKKVQHILDIWSDKVGVICLHVFQNVIPAEAYTYEAAMIDVIGLQNLKNLKTGNYYGVASSWPHRDRRMLGLYLLYKAMLIFLCEGERQLRPDDI
ncbi:ankyrin repeat and LEM domain-containing protein 1-like [Melitaea cinxia]|uniref:ankyrin repeat and LEM domain-containing protein 1-like n=1 Tax=Melitaea cinxia TaxID=113334 RepID=UPI001E2708DC|nr:ankyrin repeat and LEM domain-containing protein 1-like [Melitaea cinxia]